jgi:hypothetical protein
MELSYGTRVRATEDKNEIHEGDTGFVSAAWVKQIVLVNWDNGKVMPIHRKRLELEGN